MPTNAADPIDEDADSGTTTFERKRPHDVVSRDDASNAGSAQSTPRKRVKYAGKLRHQEIRDFVPVGASFSTSAVPVEEAEDSGDEGFQAGKSPKAENLSDYEVVEVLESDIVEQGKALVEGRRLFISDLPPDVREEDLKQIFKGYSIENIWIPDLMGDDSQIATVAQKENLSLDGDSHMTNPSIGTAAAGTNDGSRLEKVNIPVNPRTRRPFGYAFVTVSSPEEADRATSQLSGHEILDRKVSIQRARAEETRAPDPGTIAAENGASNIRSKRTEGYHGTRSVKVGDESEEDNKSREISEFISPQDVQAAPPVNWNSVNTTKIRTTLGKVKDSVDEPSLANGGRKEAEGYSERDLATSVALERIEGLRIRLSALDPHDGPISAYKSAQQELHNAEVDYNYCLYFPAGEAFQPPPRSTARNSTQKTQDGREYRLRIWSMVEQCMKEGVLQDLKEGKTRVSSAERSSQPSPGQNSAFESSDGLEQTNGQQDLQTSSATLTDAKQIRILESQEMYRKQSGYLKAFPYLKPGSNNYEKMKKRIHETEIYLNYCQYFPATEDYLPLALAKKGLNELNSSNLEGIRACERRAAQIWKLVEQCAQDGNLQDLKDGRLAPWLKDAPPPNQSFFASALQARHSQGFAKMTGHNHKPQHDCGRKEASKGVAGAASANGKLTPKQEGKSGERQGSSESDGGVILNLDYGNRDMPSEIVNKVIQPVMHSGNKDEEIPSNVDEQDIKQELPATDQVDDDLYASETGAASNSDTESNDSVMDREGQSEDDDGMMQYSNSERIAAEEGDQNTEMVAIPASHKAHILADLDVHDLINQLRYFHTTKIREEVDGNTPVRCLVCMEEGHMAGICGFLTCAACGAFDQHTTQACPQNTKCAKCREQGHDKGHCPYKLKKMHQHEIVCDLCQRNGHVEENCELIWRTSGRPWDSDLANANVRLFCSQCGRSGHLGNDCPSRKPNKSMGTTTWDSNVGQVSIESTRDFKIKGKANQQDPISIDDSDDDQANFFRPKVSVPEPVRRGQIRINTGRRESPIYETNRNDRQAHADHRRGSFTPVNESYRDEEARQPYKQYQDGGRGNWRAGDGSEYDTGHNDPRYSNYGPSERRSRSPPYRGHGGYADENSWPTTRPAPRAEHQGRRPPADANVYRPMPGAAQKAWTRRRV